MKEKEEIKVKDKKIENIRVEGSLLVGNPTSGRVQVSIRVSIQIG